MDKVPAESGCHRSTNKLVILIAMDGSEHSLHAFDWFMDNMYKPGSQLIVVHCSDYKDLMWTPVMTADSAAISNMIQIYETETSNAIAHIQERLSRAKVDAKLLRLSGDPGSTIIKAANENKVDYIVTGSRGLGTVRRTLLGSVSNYIVHHAHCPVLVCPSKNQ